MVFLEFYCDEAPIVVLAEYIRHSVLWIAYLACRRLAQ